MKCIITGASGFIGFYLTEFLLSQGAAVYGLDQVGGQSQRDFQGDFHFIPCNILDKGFVAETIKNIRPDFIFHLAAQSLPKASWEDPETTFRINIFGTLYLLDAVRAAGINPVIEIFCSSSEYAVSKDNTLISEDYPLESSSPYALSKIAQDHLGSLYHKAYQMKIVRVRPFFIIGPHKVGDVCSDFARGIVAIENRAASHLQVGNLEAVRDFLDVRDAVAAFARIAFDGKPGEVYNVCSGIGRRISEIVDELKKLSAVPVVVKTDSSRLRRLDEPIKVGDNKKLCALGWKPSIRFQDSLKNIIEFWRAKEKNLFGKAYK